MKAPRPNTNEEMKAITFRSKKAKGIRLEAKLAQLIREYDLDKDAKRMIGSGAFAGWKTDIFTRLPFSFECKNTETLQFWKYWKQAQDQSSIAKPPILVYSANSRPIMAILNIETFLNLLKEVQDLNQIIEESRNG